MKIVLVVPPFATTHCPSTAIGTLKAILHRNGFHVEVLYLNFLFRKKLYFDFYERIISSFNFHAIGEYIFSDLAFDKNRAHIEKIEDALDRKDSSDTIGARFARIDEINELKKLTGNFLLEATDAILEKDPDVVGFTLKFQQMCSTIAIANRVKKNNPEITTVIGGFCCTDPMGKAISDIAPSIDYVFGGEADHEFVRFCMDLKNGIQPARKIIDCVPVNDLNELPYPDYSDYFSQLKEHDLEADAKYINFESSRGCWWRNVSHCVFCGIDLTKYRTKKPSRVIDEINHLASTYNMPFINATDSILAGNFVETVFGNFTKPGVVKNIFYEVKPTLRLEELRILRSAGMNTCQPGIETFNDELLGILQKGTTTAGNIGFLRDCRSLGITPLWNFLVRIPGEKKEHYLDMIENVIPGLYHLQPPVRLIPLMIHRYSPLFWNSEKYDITNLRPIKEYDAIFPPNAEINNLAYYFEGEYRTAFEDEQLEKSLLSIVEKWLSLWEEVEMPVLRLIRENGRNIVLDTRSGEKRERREIGDMHCRLLKSFETPVSKNEIRMTAELECLIGWRCILETGNYFVSLVCRNDFV